MLTAKLKDGTTISMCDQWTFIQLKDMREEVNFYCPCCTAELLLKIGDKKQWHFAHKKGSSCTVQGEPESLYHLRGKKQLYEWIRKQGYKAALEVYLPLIRQRPDVLFKVKDQLYAIEYQCSVIEESQIRKRSKGYEQLGIIPIWIFGGNRLKRVGAKVFSIQSFEWYASSILRDIPSVIHYYCSDLQKFITLTHPSPISKMKHVAPLREVSNQDFLLAHLLHMPDPISSFNENWIEVKKKWRYAKAYPYPTPTDRFFQQLLYHHRIPPSLFPIEAGWPTPSYSLIETSPHIWQTYLLYACLLQKPTHHPITFRSIHSCFLKKEGKRWLKMRSFYQPVYLEETLAGYLTFLTEAGFLQVISEQPKTYMRLRDAVIPLTVEEANQLDHKLLHQSRKNLHVDS
ncbi:competence protein CoiA [Alkalihalophilus marmarensis]|uniref:Competence protein CoiA n=1 Tax=Alkalihalophilus marmarensis DSM 21297 TaxID=1188261 RepID=U6SNF5_9BACI|nr:competence protein CoiA family protein [Alkalihalophilus marmarensis]ERN52892.1 hypothetical protein A33I_14510 [Alkalihalophilus marmarensis DSM 21297]MCM3489146.1 hypothetical protein [Alkalihalophilus marmarensis]MED1601057.1 competence protein CoiA family protein [Alkalihalophilus marmarensis]